MWYTWFYLAVYRGCIGGIRWWRHWLTWRDWRYSIRWNSSSGIVGLFSFWMRITGNASDTASPKINRSGISNHQICSRFRRETVHFYFILFLQQIAENLQQRINRRPGVCSLESLKFRMTKNVDGDARLCRVVIIMINKFTNNKSQYYK